jgi:hypothetical protein
MAIEPFAATGSTDNGGNAVPSATVELGAVPAGKLLVVEHVSGQLAVKDGDVVNFLQAAAQGADSVVYHMSELRPVILPIGGGPTCRSGFVELDQAPTRIRMRKARFFNTPDLPF